MLIEHILVWVIVSLAALYLFRHLRSQFSPKKNCGGACKGCSAAKFEK